MDFYTIGKDVKEILDRLERIENLIKQSAPKSSSTLDDLCKSSTYPNNTLNIKFVNENAEIVPLDCIQGQTPFQGRNIRFMSNGHCSSDCNFLHICTSKYNGSVWAEDVNNGDRIVWHYIEVNIMRDANISAGQIGDVRVTANNSTYCSWDINDRDNDHNYYAWAKFRMANGAGFDVGPWSCRP